MTEKHPLEKLKQGTEVLVTLCGHTDVYKTGDIRRTLVKQVSGESILLSQPREPLTHEHVGLIMNISWIEIPPRGESCRRMVDAELISIEQYKLTNRVSQVLLFGKKSELFYGTLRREERLPIPENMNIFVDIIYYHLNIGKRNIYCKIIDLSTLGLRFVFNMELSDSEGNISEDIGIDIGDEINLNLFIDDNWIFNVEAIVRTIFIPDQKNPMIFHFGAEFSKLIETDFENDTEVKRDYTPKDGKILTPYLETIQLNELL